MEAVPKKPLIDETSSPSTSVGCMESFLKWRYGLQKINLEDIEWAPTNAAIPSHCRGVWWIDSDKSPGVTADLNMLSSTPDGKYFIKDAATMYQSFKPTKAGCQLFAISSAMSLCSTVSIGVNDGPTVEWSLFGGCCSLPYESPSEKVNEHQVKRIIKKKGKVIAEYPAYRVIDADGKRTEHFEAMVQKVGNQVYVKPGKEKFRGKTVDMV